MIKKYLVIGNPVDHSLSPKLHNYWLKENNIDAIYDKKSKNKPQYKYVVIFSLSGFKKFNLFIIFL